MTTDTDDNPYAAPIVSEITTESHKPPGLINKPSVLQTAWLLAVLLNLPVPIMFGESAVSDARALVGLPLGIAAVYFTGVLVCLQRSGPMWRLIVGSGITALSQFFPFAHMMIGLLAMGLSESIFDPDRSTRDISSLPEAALATILTGLGLILPSLLMGAGVFVIFRIKVFDAQPNKDL